MLRKVIWMTSNATLDQVKQINSIVKGEIIQFIEGSYLIIGDAEAEKRFKEMSAEAEYYHRIKQH